MTWMLDTNVCIRYLNGRSPRLKQRIDACSESDVVVCSIVKGELFFGAQRSTDPQLTLTRQKQFLSRFASYTFDDRCAEAYGEIRANLTARGKPIGPNDLLIAAIARTHGLTLVTRNTAEFSRVPGLLWENWEAAG